ncbi:hypothetical protein N7G274_006192 [Stereocaulon virgatum]|uniref:Uncharacterized protein n=1 Tax=Stereocaulon virgatum TaxID=373712 RepID=A0ABR4A5Q8_9LECA
MSAPNPSHEDVPWTPKTGMLTYLPLPWLPYAELMRLHRPVGIMSVFFPYLFGSLVAACVSLPTIKPRWLLARCTYLFIAAFILRSAGCTWNDIADRDLDRLVVRTRLRPMARRAISLFAAYLFTAAQVAIWLGLLSQMLPRSWLLYAAPLLFLVWLYPFAKRFTDFAQIVLGVTLGWGVLIGAAAIGSDILAMGASDQHTGLLGLYLIYVVCSVIHDTVYAHQDVRDDMKAGIGSMAVRWLHSTKPFLWTFAVAQVGLLWAVGGCMRAGMWYYCIAVGENGTVLSAMISQLDLSDSRSCLWWFQTGSLLIGGSISVGLLGEYFARLRI